MTKIRVAVLRGGPSSEYEVSLKSGQTVLKNLPEKYLAKDIFISKNGTWHIDGLERSPERLLATFDVVFNALHGEYGEDGQVQRILETHGIPYTGSDSLASALAMNKHLTKQVVTRHAVKTPLSWRVRVGDRAEAAVSEIFASVEPPYVVKPVSLGSSVGVEMVKTVWELSEAIRRGLSVSPALLVEECIVGTEATCGVVENFRGAPLYSLLPIEIRVPTTSAFFDYNAKYSGISEELCPGNFSTSDKKELERLAALVHEVLGLRHYSRSDFIVTPNRGIYFLEANTLPGLTSESLLPKAVYAVGSDLPSFFDHVLTLALERR